jgi:hypothetical protein
MRAAHWECMACGERRLRFGSPVAKLGMKLLHTGPTRQTLHTDCTTKRLIDTDAPSRAAPRSGSAAAQTAAEHR